MLLTRSGAAPDAVAAAGACAPPWPEELARAALAALRSAISAPHRSHSPAALATAAARCLSPFPAVWPHSGPPASPNPGEPGRADRPNGTGRTSGTGEPVGLDGPAGELARLAGSSRCPPAWSSPLRRAARTLDLRRIFLEEIR
jgi:hypothetical protein